MDSEMDGTKYLFKNIAPDVKDANREVITALWEPLNQNIWLYGKPGRGKTHIAKCAVQRIRRQGNRAIIATGNIFREIGESFHRQDEFAKYIYHDLVVLDDLDKCVWTPKAIEALWYFLDCRAKWRKHVIVTANVEGKAMLKILIAGCPQNESMAFAAIDRLNPCQSFEVKAPKSKRRELTLPVLTAKTPEPIETISPQDAARVRASGAKLSALAGITPEKTS